MTKPHPPAHFLALFLPGFLLVALYNLALIEGRYSLFLHLQPFRTGRPMDTLETAAFVLLFGAELVGLMLLLALLPWWLTRHRSTKAQVRAAIAGPLLALGGYALAVTLQFQVLRYFRDGLDLMLARQLGGGSLLSALGYAVDELGRLAPWLAAALVGAILAFYLISRLGRRLVDFFEGLSWLRRWITPGRVLLLNLLLFPAAFWVAYQAPVLDKNLGHLLAHKVYLAPWRRLTDFDGDGYGLIPRPADQAPFDPRRHPYAYEIPGNGEDEDGVGGDLPQLLWRPPAHAPWDPQALARRNVLLIVLESARADLLDARHQGQWVMPRLRQLPGQPLTLVAHTAFTAPAIVSLFNGVLSDREQAPSLIERFGALGYRTAVFSAQNEGFGHQDEKSAMDQADHFFDARSAPADKRMYLSRSAIALALPWQEVVPRAEAWLARNDDRPFFLYVNLQELHYPYSHDGMAHPLVERPIPRYQIHEAEREWLLASYHNAARVADQAIGHLVDFLQRQGRLQETLILVVGDHGEELFDAGSLGHGTRISQEQNRPLGKLINSPWRPPAEIPIGLSEVPKLIHNALAKEPARRQPLSGEALAFLGVRKPLQIGLFDADGLTTYDFRSGQWRHQRRFGDPDTETTPLPRLIHLWESYLLATRPPKKPQSSGDP